MKAIQSLLKTLPGIFRTQLKFLDITITFLEKLQTQYTDLIVQLALEHQSILKLTHCLIQSGLLSSMKKYSSGCKHSAPIAAFLLVLRFLGDELAS
jgi:hypothetical protein